MSLYDDEKADFVRQRLRDDHRMRKWALGKMLRLHRGVASEDEDAMRYRDCAFSSAVWKIIKPVAELMFRGIWVPQEQYELILNALSVNAEAIARLLPDDEYLAELNRTNTTGECDY